MSLADLHDHALGVRLRYLLDHKTKPPGSLGRLESLALQIGLVLGTEQPRLEQPQIVLFAADHGLAAHGVSEYTDLPTSGLVANVLDGGAAVSVLARQHGLALTVVDCGVRGELAPRPGLMPREVAPGTADALHGPAMTPDQCRRAMDIGRDVVACLPGNALLLGELGVGNTSAAALLLAALTGCDLDDCLGPAQPAASPPAHKRDVLARVLQRHAGVRGPLDVLAALGGLEIAAMAGAVLEASARRKVVLVDGFVASSAVLVARALAPRVLQRCIFSHRCGESGHALMLRHLGLDASSGARPLLDLGLRLGEGCGAALAWPLLVSACALLREMAGAPPADVARSG